MAGRDVCTTSSGRLFITDKQQYLVDTGSDLCFFPRKLLPGRWERTDYTLYAVNGTNTLTRPSARCGTSHSTGPSPTGVTAIYHASPDNSLHRRTHSCAASPDPQASSDNRLHRRTHSCAASPDPHASPDNRLHRWTHSSAASPYPCATADNQLPRTDSLACSSSDRLPRHPNTSSRPPTPHRSWPFGRRSTDSSRLQKPSPARLQQNLNQQPNLKRLHDPGALYDSRLVTSTEVSPPRGEG
jgi:hypothetical protein